MRILTSFVTFLADTSSEYSGQVQGYRIKVKVAGAQKREISFCRPSLTDTAQSRCKRAVTASPFQSFYVPAAKLIRSRPTWCEDFKLLIISIDSFRRSLNTFLFSTDLCT